MRNPLIQIKATTMAIRKAFSGVYSELDELREEIELIKAEKKGSKKQINKKENKEL